MTDVQPGSGAAEQRPTSGPAPRWGEYAPLPPAPPEPAIHPVGPAQQTPIPPAPTRAAGGAPVRKRRTWDLVLTIALLAYGLMTVLASLGGASDLGSTLDQVYAIQGLGHYEPSALAASLTGVANLAQVLLLALAAFVSYRLLKAGRIAFWVPLVAGAVASLLVGVLGLTLMLGDPTFQEYLGSVG